VTQTVSNSDSPLATVVVVPRERFSRAVWCLQILYDRTDEPFELVYVDSGGGSHVRRTVANMVNARGHTLVRTRRWVTPQEARNLGAAHVSTRYTVFLDNDVEVTSGWLDALVRCAEQTGCDVVGPWIGLGPLGTGREHHNGGTIAVEDGPAGRRLVEEYDRSGALHRRRSTHFEFHCLLVRTDTLRAVGPLDEGLTALEHLDLCLGLRERGATGWLEPESVVSYIGALPARLADAPYYLLRWNGPWVHASLSRFAATWRVAASDTTLAVHRRVLTERRRLILRPYRYGLRDRFGRWSVRIADVLVDLVVAATSVPWSSLRRRVTPGVWRHRRPAGGLRPAAATTPHPSGRPGGSVAARSRTVLPRGRR
jgi:GT2 family glycosyltransferase